MDNSPDLSDLQKAGYYVETECVVEYEGQRFEAGGAIVTPEKVIAYLGNNGKLHDWHGRELGSYRITSSWRIHSCMTSTMYQVEALVQGVTYTGRSGGVGLIYRGRRKRS